MAFSWENHWLCSTLTLTSVKLVLVWTPGKGSPIHDHGNAHCLMKILKGNLTETRYEFPTENVEGPMKVISEKTYKENAVAYMADELGVHSVSNRGSEFAVSLHCKQYLSPTKPLREYSDRYDDSIYSTKCCKGRLPHFQRPYWQEKPCVKMWLLLGVRSLSEG